MLLANYHTLDIKEISKSLIYKTEKLLMNKIFLYLWSIIYLFQILCNKRNLLKFLDENKFFQNKENNSKF